MAHPSRTAAQILLKAAAPPGCTLPAGRARPRCEQDALHDFKVSAGPGNASDGAALPCGSVSDAGLALLPSPGSTAQSSSITAIVA